MKAQKHTIKLLLSGLFALCLALQANAQVYEIVDYKKRAAIARDHIRNLHDGTLVIRLRSKSNNIKAMKRALASDNLSSKERKRLTKRLDRLTKEIKNENHKIVDALRAHYTFSEYRMVLDTAIHELFEKKENGYFLNEKLETDPDLSIDFNKPVYILKYGPTKTANNNRHEGLIFTDFEKNDLESPFPYLTKVMWPRLAVFSFFVGKNDPSPRYYKMIEHTNNALHKFYAQSEIKREKDKLRQQIKDLKD